MIRFTRYPSLAQDPQKRIEMISRANTCILMFSGGRDSTLAAVRLSRLWQKLILVTVTSEHLTGLSNVKRRLVELRHLLPDDTEWLHVVLPQTLNIERPSTIHTCLPCHQAYIVSGVITAEKYNAKHMALGYTGYQSNWPEQTLYARTRLSQIMKDVDIEVLYPVLDITTKEDAITELIAHNLTEKALEQKCTRQVLSVVLESDLLVEEINRWSGDLISVLANRSNLQPTIATSIFLSDFSEQSRATII